MTRKIDSGSPADLYCIVRKNFVADFLFRIPTRCYIDTRVLAFKGSFGSELFSWIGERYESFGAKLALEHEVFNFVCIDQVSNVEYFESLPSLRGRSGHGRNYDSFSSKIRHFFAQILFRLGIS